MKIFIKSVVIIISIPLIYGYASAIYELALKIKDQYKEHLFFISGLGFAIILFPIFTKNKFLRTFEHEMTHLIFAKIFFGKIKKLNVTDEGSGFVEYSASPNPFIGLSPYFFPLFSVFFAILIPLLNPAISKYFFLLVGYFLLQHLLFSIKEILSSQPDIKEEGSIFSFFFITLFLLFIYGIIISSIISRDQIILFIKSGATRSFELTKHLINFIIEISYNYKR